MVSAQTAAADKRDVATSQSSNDLECVIQRHAVQISRSALHGATTNIDQHTGISRLLGNEIDQHPLPVISIVWILWYGGAA